MSAKQVVMLWACVAKKDNVWGRKCNVGTMMWRVTDPVDQRELG